MANEATITSTVRITRNGVLIYSPQPRTFRADVDEGTGPTPGELLVDPAGQDVIFTDVTTPGLCRMHNRENPSSPNSPYVMVGIHDGLSFFPLLELLPGEFYPLRLCRHLGDEFTGTGTGTPSDQNTLHLKTPTGTARVNVDIFGK